MNCYSSIINNGKLECFSVDGNFHLGSEYSLSDSVFLWNRKNNYCPNTHLDIKDICNFYRLFNLNDIKTKWHNIDCDSYEAYKKQLKAVVNSYRNTKINISPYGLSDLAPQKILSSYLISETKLLNCILEELNENEWYDDFISFLQSELCKTSVLNQLRYQVNTIDGPKIVDLDYQSNFRFKSLPGALSLFTMQKHERKNVIPWPEHKMYVADFRQFEVRTLLKLCNVDIDFSRQEIYQDIANEVDLDADDVKQQIIAFGYGQENKKLEKIINKDNILDCIDDEIYRSEVGELVIAQKSDPDHIKIHTIVQTISQYSFLRKLDKILKLLDNKQSKFIFPLHDAIIISLHPEEEGLIDDLRGILEDDLYKIKEYIDVSLDNI